MIQAAEKTSTLRNPKASVCFWPRSLCINREALHAASPPRLAHCSSPSISLMAHLLLHDRRLLDTGGEKSVPHHPGCFAYKVRPGEATRQDVLRRLARFSSEVARCVAQIPRRTCTCPERSSLRLEHSRRQWMACATNCLPCLENRARPRILTPASDKA